MKANYELHQRIEALIHETISERLGSCRGFTLGNWPDWPGTKTLSGLAADAVFGLLEKERILPSQHLESLVPNGFLVEDRVSTTREDRAYQVLCALLTCSRAPMGSTAGELANIAWALVGCMEERGAQGDAE